MTLPSPGRIAPPKESAVRRDIFVVTVIPIFPKRHRRGILNEKSLCHSYVTPTELGEKMKRSVTTKMSRLTALALNP